MEGKCPAQTWYLPSAGAGRLHLCSEHPAGRRKGCARSDHEECRVLGGPSEPLGAVFAGRATFPSDCMQMSTCAFWVGKGSIALKGFCDPEKVAVYLCMPAPLLLYRCGNEGCGDEMTLLQGTASDDF